MLKLRLLLLEKRMKAQKRQENRHPLCAKTSTYIYIYIIDQQKGKMMCLLPNQLTVFYHIIDSTRATQVSWLWRGLHHSLKFDGLPETRTCPKVMLVELRWEGSGVELISGSPEWVDQWHHNKLLLMASTAHGKDLDICDHIWCSHAVSNWNVSAADPQNIKETVFMGRCWFSHLHLPYMMVGDLTDF